MSLFSSGILFFLVGSILMIFAAVSKWILGFTPLTRPLAYTGFTFFTFAGGAYVAYLQFASETVAVNEAEKPYEFCAVITKIWQERTGGGGGGLLTPTDPIDTTNKVAYRVSGSGKLGATSVNDATYGALKAGDDITISHVKSDLVEYSGREVWFDTVSEGCHAK